MSLLIKALEKAEKGKAADGSGELTLEPIAKTEEPTADATQKQASQQAAATVFTAKTEPSKKQGTSKVWLIGGALLLILAVIGMQFYAYLNSLSKPDVVVARAPVTPAVPLQSANPAVVVEPSPQASAEASELATSEPVSGAEPAVASTSANAQKGPGSVVPTATPEQSSSANTNNQAFREPAAANQLASAKPKAPVTKSQQLAFGDPLPGTNDAGVKITRNQPAMGVNPNLLAAYQAFNAGDDAAAQRNYRQVLQGDVRNVDALLGMAAIAARQGRNNDAAGWYGKVLEVEPRNNVAQSAMVNVLAQADPVSSESRIKSLIAQQPEAAHLYASLGNLYAEQSQWPSAQQAYFQAFHFDQNNAEYAFNLAVSLEQIGKPGLALPYYQRALALLPVNGASSIDRAQLESRIAKLQ
ncbi:MAG: tetratricopeptide repeat protein [Methylophilaceae bacterium]